MISKSVYMLYALVRVFFHKDILSGLSTLFFFIPLIPIIIYFDKNGNFKKNDKKE